MRFPAGFKWCVATAAHQIEGGNEKSDHYQWEVSAPDRVISRELVTNPLASEILRQAGADISSQKIACPEVSTLNTISGKYDLFPLGFPDHLVRFRSSSPGKEKFCEYSGKSIDHWNRVDQDILLLKHLGVQDYRMSIEWAKIEPEKGRFDATALAHYTTEIHKLRLAGIRPEVTLFHFTMPQWLRSEGGWENPESAHEFARFTETVYRAFGPEVQTWYTFNEPMVHLTAGYLAGVLPPGEQAPQKMIQLMSTILRAHAASYHVLHKLADAAGASIQVGIAHHLRIFDPLTTQATWQEPHVFIKQKIETAGARLADQLWNWLFFDALETGKLAIDMGWVSSIGTQLGFPLPTWLNFQQVDIADLKGTQDFLGLNYYTRDTIEFNQLGFEVLFDGDHSFLSKITSSLTTSLKPIVQPSALARDDVSDLKWELYPEGFYRILKALDSRGKKYSNLHRSIIVSENGIADATDNKRIRFLQTHLAAMARAMSEGVPVAGYCYWTLIDNYEWNSGYAPKFGLYSVDLGTQERTIRPSGDWYAKLIRNNGWAASK